MADKGNIRTGVDGLIELLSSRDKVSLPDISKELGVPQSTLESWVDFLVEEGKVEVEYKFTTPFVSLKEHPDNEDDHEPTEDLDSEIQFDMQLSHPDIKDDSGTMTVSDSIREVNARIDEGDIDSAYHAYMAMKESAEHNISEDEMKEVISANQKLVSKIEEIQSKSREMLNQMDSLLQQLYDDMSKGDMDHAKELYSKISGFNSSIPSILSREKTAAYSRLSNAFRAIQEKEHELAQNTMAEAEDKVASIRASIAEMINEGNMDEAEKYYQSLCSIYEYLPESLLEEKLKIYNKILRIHREIVLARKFKEIKEELQSMGSSFRLVESAGKLGAHAPHDDMPPPDKGYPSLPDEIEEEQEEIFPEESEKDVPDVQNTKNYGVDGSNKISSESSSDNSKYLYEPGTDRDDGNLPEKNPKSSSHPGRLSEEAPLPTVVSNVNPEDQDKFSDAPVVGKHRKDIEPINPDLIFTDDSFGVIETIPRETARDDGREDHDDERYNLFVEDMVEHEDEYAEGIRVPIKILARSYLRDYVSDDEMLRRGIDAYNEKDYFMAKHIFELMVKHDPKNTRARQLRDFIRGILEDRNDEFYLARRMNIALN
ncbi:MAG: hypothetical protein ACLFNK_01050 [Candidatus Woesearchaeota archaeon]